MKDKQTIILPPEWGAQSAVQLTWPHEETDWLPILNEVIPCFVSIATEIIRRQKLIIVCRNERTVRKQLGAVDYGQIIFRELPSNDTWARDHGPISVYADGARLLLDFTFNGWGLKFPANLDNQLTTQLYQSGTFSRNVSYVNQQHRVLEGGSFESDGEGTLLTTFDCLGSVNRNGPLREEELELWLKETFGLRRVLWLRHGYLAGDDTDSHVDTLARFCDAHTIAYVLCTDKADEHYESLKRMEEELLSFRTATGEPYQLIALPMAEKVLCDGKRLPATYANFLIINGAVLVPFYQSPFDEVARGQLQVAFPDREVIGIDCLPLIKQHGSLHCVTMQYPEGFVE